MKSTRSWTTLALALGLFLVSLTVFAGETPDRPRPGFGGPHGPRGEGFVARMAEELELSEEQSAALQGIFDKYHDGAKGQALREARARVHEVVTDPAADEQQVLEAVRQASALAEQRALERHQMTIEISQVLNEEQLRKLDEMRELRAERRGRGGRHRGPAGPAF
jgi:Spy/CpxP family protein refolding chaperone